MILQTKDIFKKLATCQYGVSGKHLALHKQGEAVSLRYAHSARFIPPARSTGLIPDILDRADG